MQSGKGDKLRKRSRRLGKGWGILEFLVSCTLLSAQGGENAITRALSAFSGKGGV